MQLTAQSHIEQTVMEQTLHNAFKLQRSHFLEQGIETLAQRKQHLLNLKALINNHREAIIDALNQDYGTVHVMKRYWLKLLLLLMTLMEVSNT